MHTKLKLAVAAMCCATSAAAQVTDQPGGRSDLESEQEFTFTEAQLGEDDDMSENIIIVNSNSNIYASESGYLFSATRFRYRALDQRYNEIFINGAPMNDAESGQFRYSLIGGLNNQSRDVEYSLPFESNSFAMPGLAGSNNYNFRPSHYAAGHRVALTGANRNYTMRAMYTYNSGLSENGWAFTGNLTYRWADRGYVEGTFYNSLSYFLGIEKMFNSQHSLSLVTWGNPTERASQGPATDESYWLANSNYYNPYWGYQDGKVRNSRVITDFAPTVLLTWDWNINETMRLTTAFSGKYSIYKSTKLNYNNSENPQPDYWKNLPSSYYDVWDDTDLTNRTEEGLANWNTAYDYLTASKANRQINWNRLYAANEAANAQGADALYYVQAKHNNQLAFTLSSSLKTELTKNTALDMGFILATTKGMHYQTMDDLLGATTFHNINTYALGTYSADAEEVQYDLNNPNALVGVGDRFGYDYNIFVNKANAWATYTFTANELQGFANAVKGFVSGRVGGVAMQREGNMRNGMAKDNSFGKSGTARFLDGGFKVGAAIDFGGGSLVTIGAGYEAKAPSASVSFQAPEVNNDFVTDLVNEKVFSGEVGYQLDCSWLHANISGYYYLMTDVTEWQQFYFDNINSFSYVSLTGIRKEAYGVEWGLEFKVTPAFSVKTFGTVSEAKNTNNSKVRYMNSNLGIVYDDICMNDGMRASGTPLSIYNIGLSYHAGGWYIDLNGNYYDRIYLSYAPNLRYQSTLETNGYFDGVNYEVPEQLEGKGGFMLDASIGRSIYLKKGMLSVNLSITNILNNRNITTGGFEQSRSDVTYTQTGEVNSERTYKFSRNPKLYYAYGINGMLNITYRF